MYHRLHSYTAKKIACLRFLSRQFTVKRIAMATTSSSSSLASSSATDFRSLLPHEPMPREERGYVLLQGAFQPRRNDDDGKPGPIVEDYWTQKGLQDCLTRALGLEVNNLGLPCPAIHVQIVKDEPPFTQARITYETPQQALRVVSYTRHQQSHVSFARMVRIGNTLSHESSKMTNLIFPTKALQWTRLTQQPRPDVCWTRSSPPKFRRLLPKPGEDLDALQDERTSTRFLFVTNLLTISGSSNTTTTIEDEDEREIWKESWVAAEAIRSVMNEYDTTGHGVEVFCTHKKLAQYCHVGFRNASDAQMALARLQEQQVKWTWIDIVTGQQKSATSGKLFLDYAAVTERSWKRAQLREAGAEVPKGEPTRSECTSTTDHIHVPGLLLVPEFCTTEEEEILLSLLLGPQAPWAPSQRTPTEGGIVKRRVQHYGYVFDYKTADVLRDKAADPTADCPPMPKWSSGDDCDNASFEDSLSRLVQEGRSWPVLAGIMQRIRQTDFDIEGKMYKFPTINQMTLNHYEPGEGIGSHVDTPSAFGDGLMSLSLQSGIVMEFRLQNTDRRKLVYLPPRSLVVMTGPARYEWEHHVVTRRTDTHNGKVIPRGVRVSLTFRTALKEDGAPLPLLETDNFPLRWGREGPNSFSENTAFSSLVTPECERRHVHEVYDAIARQWHHTRGRRGVLWPGATQFLQRL